MGEFKALMSKNFKYWKRNKCGMLCEIATTIAFALFLLLVGTLSDDTNKPATSYLPINKRIGVSSSTPGDNWTDKQKYQIEQFSHPTPPYFLQRIMKNCTKTNFKTNQGEGDSSGYVVLGPKSNPIVSGHLTTLFKDVYKFPIKYLEGKEALDQYVKSDGYGGLDKEGKHNQVCFAIFFEKAGEENSHQWRYTFHFNETGNPEFRDLYGGDMSQPEVKKFEQEDTSLLATQMKSGLFYMINLIDTEILRTETKQDEAFINAYMVPTPTQAYKTSQIYQTLQGKASNFIVFPLIIIFLRFSYNILYEKEHKIAQNLRNMGMSMNTYFFSWYLFYTIILLILTTIWALITKSKIAPDANFLLYMSLYFMPGMFFISFGLFITSFFTKAKTGILFCIISYFVLFGVGIAKTSISGGDLNSNTWFALSPLSALDSATDIILSVQSFYQPFRLELLNTEIEGFKFIRFLLITGSEIVLFFFLAIYLEQVFPKDTGVAKHPLFCLKKRKQKHKRRRGTKRLTKIDSLKGSQTDSFVIEGFSKEELFEQVDDPILALSEEDKTLEIKELHKIFGNEKHAVRGINLTMYSDQIFALLGHNGAGKTTTISMISGLLPLSSGKITVMGLDSRADTEEIKEIMGVCPQTNPIYPTLTVGEHLYLYSHMKKTELNDADLDVEIDKILKDIDLLDKKGFPAGNLSGGQKRKLCVACAFIGGSKVILLDEPTSGLDVSARRHLWNMLKQYKKDKIIILTTHFMDEADYLGDRIGVMGEGKLLTCGSSMFLKNKFGFGYGLTLVKENSEVSTEKVTQMIESHVQGAKLEGDISKELKYILPTSEIAKFENLFKDLDDKGKSELGIESYGVSLTTLEDVFLRIGQQMGKNKKEIEEDMKTQNRTKKNTSFHEKNLRLQDIRVVGAWAIFWMHFIALVKKRFIYFRRDRKSLICEIFLPIVIIFLGMSVTKIQFIRNTEPQHYTPAIFPFRSQIWVNDVSNSTNPKTKQLSENIPQDNWDLITKNLKSNNIKSFNELLEKNAEEKRLVSSFLYDVDFDKQVYQYNLFLNTTSANSLHVGLTQMDTAVLRTAVGDKNAYIDIEMIPLPLTDQIKSFQGFVNGFLTCFFIAIAFSFLPSSLIMFLVKERENNAKLQQIVSGVSLSAYWLSNLTIDYIKYLIPAVATMLSLTMYNVDVFIGSGQIGATITLALLFGPCFIGFTYLTSFLFKGPSSAQVFTFVLSLFTGFMLMIASMVMRVLPSTRDVQLNFTEYLFRIFPMFNYCFGMYSMSSNTFWQVLFNLKSPPKPWSGYGMLKEAIAMPLTTIIFFALIFYIELKKGKVKVDESKKASQKQKNGLEENLLVNGDVENPNPENLEEEVLQEIQEVKSRDDWAVKVDGLRKEYVMFGKGDQIVSKKVAVKGITFGVNKGDCFGLLGTNGAGKTTTFKMLSGEIYPTRGICEIQGMNVVTEMKSIRHLIGYCPQFDALLNNLTAREHLELYCSIKGIPKDMHESMIQELLIELNLKNYENVQAGTYSGGNKRKLSVAIALLGNPPIVFLDEPSSGMDPEARRFMWSVVGKVTSGKNPSSVVLTTHSMEEAEALSSKLAIMVEGNIKCIGPVQKLKNKYGKGFEIETKFRDITTREMIALIQKAGFDEKLHGLNLDIQLDEDGKELVDKTLTSKIEEIGSEKINMNTINQITTKLDIPQQIIGEQIVPNGKGAYIFNELEKKGEISLKSVLEFFRIHLESQNLHQFMIEKFGTVSVLESYQRFVRTKIEDDLKVSQLFGEMERNKHLLKLDQYSVKQTSIEQIFINFAKDIEEDRAEQFPIKFESSLLQNSILARDGYITLKQKKD